MSGLVERLRIRTVAGDPIFSATGYERTAIPDPLCQDAAAAIEARDAEIARQKAVIEELAERGAKAVIAYHVAICSPKGVVPVDDLYDPQIALKIQRDMDIALKGASS